MILCVIISIMVLRNNLDYDILVAKITKKFHHSLVFFQTILFFKQLHDIGWGPLGSELGFHEVHMGGNVGKELSIAFTEVVQSRLAICSHGKAIFGALAVAGKAVLTLAALAWEGRALVVAKPLLSLARHHLQEGVGRDISKLILGEHIVVTAVNIAIVFHHAGVATGRSHGTQSRGFANPVGKRGIKQLYKHLPHVMAYPLIEHSAQEITPLAW